MTKAELKPCPFCRVELLEGTYNGGDQRWSHEANDCVNSRRFIYEHQVASWNHRPAEQALIEALKKLASNDALTVAMDPDQTRPETKELFARIEFAKQTLALAGVK